MKKLADRTFWWIELFAGLGFMTVGFFQDCSLTFGTAIISLALWPTLFLSATVCVYRLLHFKTYSKSRGFWLIAALCVTYLLSTFLNRQYGWYENIRTLIMQGILFLMVYCYKESRSAEDIRKRRVWIGFYLSACAVLTVMSFSEKMRSFIPKHRKCRFTILAFTGDASTVSIGIRISAL